MHHNNKAVAIALLVLIAVFAATQVTEAQISQSLTLETKNQLRNIVNWVASKASGPFNYEKYFGGPGGISPVAVLLAQQIADDNFGAAINETELSIAAKNALQGQPCGTARVTQYISPSKVATEFLNPFADIRVVTFSGLLVEFEKKLQANDNFRYVTECSAFDNFAFGLSFERNFYQENISFVMIAYAANPDSVCSGSVNIASTLTPFFCPSTCSHILSTTGNIMFIPAPARFEDGVDTLRDPNVVYLWNEEAATVIERTVTLDVVGNGNYTSAVGVFGNVSPFFNPDNLLNATLQLGNGVASWLLKLDTSSPTQVRGSVVFGHRILGAVVSAVRPLGSPPRLVQTDPTFNQLCVPYDAPGVGFNAPDRYRGLEYSTMFSVSDSVRVDGHQMTVFLNSAQGIDNIRIFTECENGVFCDRQTNASANGVVLETDGINPPPASVLPGARTDQSTLFYFRERSRILSTSTPVDELVSADANITPSPTASGTPSLAAGTAVQSWYFHAESTSGAPVAYTGSVTFGQPIVAIIYRGSIVGGAPSTETTLFTSDSIFGDFCTEYGTAAAYSQDRGLTASDSLSISGNRRTITVNFASADRPHEFRVLTACDSSANTEYTLVNLASS